MHILLVIADFYEDIADMLLEGAVGRLSQSNATYDIVRVPGALEIPGAIAMAQHSQLYDGYVGLGCVIRGDTSHYDYVCGESARGLMDLTLQSVPVGNGILTVESHEQAIIRADAQQKNKGAGAVLSCLKLVELKQHYSKNGA